MNKPIKSLMNQYMIKTIGSLINQLFINRLFIYLLGVGLRLLYHYLFIYFSDWVILLLDKSIMETYINANIYISSNPSIYWK